MTTLAHCTDTSPLPLTELRAMVQTHQWGPWGNPDKAPPEGVEDACGWCGSAKALHPFPYFPTAKPYETNVRIGATILALIDEAEA